MNPDIKAQWIAALRSGEFKQGRNYLHARRPDDEVDTFCCLGVLCVLAERAGVVTKGVGYAGVVRYQAIGTGSDGSTSTLPLVVDHWAGFLDGGKSRMVTMPDTGTHTGLAGLNDYERWSFEQIADIIEEQL